MGKAFVIFVASFAALGSYLSGYNIGSSNGLQSFSGFLETFGLTNENGTDVSNASNSSIENGTDVSNASNSSSENGCPHFSDEQRFILGMMVSMINLGGLFGSLFGGKPTDYAGRRVSILISGVLVVLGSSLQAASFTSWMFIVGRFTSGFGNGWFYIAGPVYIAEISPKSIRGVLTSLIGPGIALGFITGSITNLGLTRFDNGWRVSALLLCVFGCIYVVGMALLPNTPRWLMLKNRETEAREVLRKLVSSNDVDSIDKEIEDIKVTLNEHTNPNCSQEFKLMLKWRNLKRVMIGVILHFLAAACGTAIYFYSEPLLCSLGVVPFVTAIVIGILTLCGTTFTSGLVDKFGRKTILLIGALLMAVLACAAATLVFYLEENDNLVVSYVVVCLVCLFMLVYSSSWYVIPWIVTSEMFPLEVRGIAVSISTSLNWVAGYLFTQIFPFINSYGSLYMIAVIDILACLFFLFFFPETKGVSLEEMEHLFNKPWLERIDLFYYLRLGCFCPCKKKDVSVEVPVGSNSSAEDQDVDKHVNDNVIRDKKVYSLNNSYYLKTSEQSDHSERSPGAEDKVWDHYWEEFELETKDVRKETSI